MGSNNSQFQDAFLDVLSEEPINTLLSEEIRKLSYDDFTNLLGELNYLSKTCFDSNGHQLIFAVKKDTDSTIFWKATVQIACVKICSTSQKVATFRLLSLQEFLKVFKTLKCQVNAVEHCKSAESSNSSDITLSKVFDHIDSLEHKQTSNECIICFERKPEVILPCAHSYCRPCIEEWNAIQDTCPICRERLDSPDDTWVMSEVPKAEEITKEIRESLMKLTAEKRSSCSPQ